MRLMGCRLRGLVVAAVLVVAGLVTLLSTLLHTGSHIPLLMIAPTLHSPPPALQYPAHLALQSLSQQNTSSGEAPPSTRSPHDKSPAEVRQETEGEKDVVVQEELEIANAGYVQDYHPHAPEEVVEVRKTRPRLSTLVQNAKNRRKPYDRHRSSWPLALKANNNTKGKPPEELRARALSLPETSPVRVFLKEQERRRNHTTAACRSFKASISDIVAGSRGPPVSLLSVKDIIFDSTNYLTFCPVYKAASTTWISTLLELGGFWNKKVAKMPIQKALKMVYPKLSGMAAASVQTETTSFMVVRHPMERLLSAYRDKLENCTKAYYYLTYGEKMIRYFRPSVRVLTPSQIEVYQLAVRDKVKRGVPVELPQNPFATPLGPTFPEFVDYVIQARVDDEHWRPYHTHCAPCLLDFDVVLRFESLKEESELFLEYLNRTGEVTLRWANPNKVAATNEVFCPYFGQLFLYQIDKLFVKYRNDFKLYEYDIEPYRKCAKDYDNPVPSTEAFVPKKTNIVNRTR